MKKLFSIAMMTLLSAGTILAQEPRPMVPERVQRVITIKNGNLPGIFRMIRDLLAGSNVVVSSDNDHLVLSGPKEAVAGFEEIIKQLDVPPPLPPAKKNIETTVYMIIASAQPGNGTLPAALDPVMTQLKSLFTYKGFRLLESFVLRSRSGEHGDTNGFLPAGDSNLPPGTKTVYGFHFDHGTVDTSAEHVIRYDRLRLNLRVPVATGTFGSAAGTGTPPVSTQYTFMEASISTDLDVPEGKKVVVGKTSAVEGRDDALILVISAKVVD